MDISSYTCIGYPCSVINNSCHWPASELISSQSTPCSHFAIHGVWQGKGRRLGISTDQVPRPSIPRLSSRIWAGRLAADRPPTRPIVLEANRKNDWAGHHIGRPAPTTIWVANCSQPVLQLALLTKRSRNTLIMIITRGGLEDLWIYKVAKTTQLTTIQKI